MFPGMNQIKDIVSGVENAKVLWSKARPHIVAILDSYVAPEVEGEWPENEEEMRKVVREKREALNEAFSALRDLVKDGTSD